MAKENVESLYSVKCGKCGNSGNVKSKEQRVKCKCGNVFSYEEPTQEIYPALEVLEVKVKAEEPKTEKKTYACGNCSGAVSQGNSQCSKCGYTLVWE